MVYLPRPDSVQGHLKKEVIEIANYLIQVEVIPPESEVELSQPDGIKVIFGSLTEDGDRVRRPLGGKPFPEKETLKPRKGKTTLQADARLGAIFLRLHEIGSKNRGPWKTAPGVPVNTKFELYDKQLKFPDLQFVKVEDLWWGGAFKKKDFWNLTGFHFRLQDNQQNLCHMQFWTAGPKVWAEYHDHHDNAFKELHTCLSQGTIANDNKKLGGMWAPVPSTCDSIIPSAESLSIGEEAFPPPPKDVKHCGLRPLEEHGRIWHEDATGSAVYRKNNTVSYPRHQWAAGDGNGKYIDVWMALEFDAWLDFEL
ncbi:hypothetical protein BJX61DRAFT_552247 [Aspergillus egyptiacus]|nr:hypothetical protein BJX61DRAFT_552247 [Aspergillus egyptiacus]